MNRSYTHRNIPQDTHTNSHVVSYFQKEAAFIDTGAQWKALFPGFRVRGCCADDVLPGGLFLVCYKKKQKEKGKWAGRRGLFMLKKIN